jgi:hypothetical protein
MHAGDCSTRDKMNRSMHKFNLNHLCVPFADVEASET